MPLSLLLATLLAAGSAAGLLAPSSTSHLFGVVALAAGAAAAVARIGGARGPSAMLLVLAVVAGAGWRAAETSRVAEHAPLVEWFDAHVTAPGGGESTALEAQVRVRGRLMADASRTVYGAQAPLSVSEVEVGGGWAPAAGGLAVSVSGELLGSIGAWRAGRTIVAPVSMRRPTEYRNQDLPNQSRARARRGIALVGTVKSGALVEVEAAGAWWDERAADLRAAVRSAIERRVAPLDRTSAAIGTAILIGDRAALAPDVERRLQEAGTYHVIAISGGNIALLAAAVLAVLWTVGIRFAPAGAITAAILVAHAWVIGGGPSVSRATAVAAVYLGLRLIDQRTAPVHAMAVAAAAILAARPLEIAGAGFWLTFGATAALLMAASRGPRLASRQWWEPAVALVVASVAVELVLMPISAYVFERITLAGLVLNLAAVPAMGMVQAAATICTVVDAIGWDPAARLAGYVTHLAARGLIDSSGLVEWVPWATWRVPPPAFGVLAAYYALVAGWWWSGPVVDTPIRRRTHRACAAAALATWGWIAVVPSSWLPAPAGSPLRVTALDVGQGDAFLVTTPDGHTLMVDAGGVPGAFDIGDRIVGPSLRARGLRRLDYLAVTHGDLDHLGGAGALVRDFRPREVWAGVPVTGHLLLDALRARARATRTPWRWVQRGDRLEVGGLELRAHHPPLPDWERQRVRNDDSLVLEVRYGAVSVWLTGDISRAVEAELLASADPARINILKAAHHGSLTSSGGDWLRRLRPVAVLVSAGRGNLFGHPAPAVVRLYEQSGAAVFRTDRDGQIELVTNGHYVEISTFTGRRWRLR